MNHLCSIFALLLFLPAVVTAQPLPGAKLRPETQQAFDSYIRQREGSIQRTRIQGGKFLWSDEDASRRDRLKNGEVVIEPGAGAGTVEVRGGLVHDWIGAAFIPRDPDAGAGAHAGL